MIIIFGPAGAGKSVQGQILAARHGWRWLSMGQLLRDSRQPEVMKHLLAGTLVDDQITYKVASEALANAKDIKHVIMDGFPRHFPQAQWLVGALPHHKRDIALVLVLEVPKEEILNRLRLRGRADDTSKSIEERLQIFRQEINPVLEFFSQQGIKIVRVDGVGTVGQVHDRIEAELEACSLV